MHPQYQVFNSLNNHNATLRGAAALGNGTGLARWYNEQDYIDLDRAEHHTLSLYVADGYECYHKRGAQWRNGGAPNRFCLMPAAHESTWNVRGPLEFVHLYFTDAHLSTLAEQTWERKPGKVMLDERTFADDPQIAALYREFLLQLSWSESSDRLALSSAINLLLVHVLSRYTQVDWRLPAPKGGLAAHKLRRVIEFIQANLDQPLLLKDLAAQADLSEYHFARMFKQSQGLAPHQYVLLTRLREAERLLHTTQLPLVDIALACGFSSSSHLAHRFRQVKGVRPSALRPVASSRK